MNIAADCKEFLLIIALKFVESGCTVLMLDLRLFVED